MMRLGNITGLFCLSFVLLFLCVNSQTPNCTSGWFGSGCKYKCRCVFDKCEVNGSCTAPSTCQGGWFGPACQYGDLAYRRASPQQTTDGNDDTCINIGGINAITVTLYSPVFFTWMRVRVDQQASIFLDALKVSFYVNTTEVSCANRKVSLPDNRSLDIHCILEQNINKVTLRGDAVSQLCSVYVSGGRNVALKETAGQESTYSEVVDGLTVNYSADKAVDGDTRQHFKILTCSLTKNTSTWSLFFSQPRIVQRYVIYNRMDAEIERLLGFKLESYNALNVSRYLYTEPAVSAKSTYVITHAPLPVALVKVTAANSRPVQLCEVEIYGGNGGHINSICDQAHYGRECELTCQCPNSEACFVSTGGCPTVCLPGSTTAECQTSCSVGKFGANCSQSCSENCVPTDSASVSTCNATTGVCVKGCKSGYYGNFCQNGCSEKCAAPSDTNTSLCDKTGVCTSGCKNGFSGAHCQDGCELGKFGENCSLSCGPNCELTGDAMTSSCDYITGDCILGCRAGFFGALCHDACPPGKYGLNCSASCSSNCAPKALHQKSQCDPIDGNCHNGCLKGFTGTFCIEASAATTVPNFGVMYVGLFLVLAILPLLGFLVCRRKNPRARPETSLGELTEMWPPVP